MRKLGIVIASTRPGRVGLPVARWFFERAKVHGKMEVELVDLAEWNLPLLDEPKHPRFRDYQHDHTRRWSAAVAALDAFVFVTPEYNFGAPPALLNAIDYLFHEWSYKVAGFVSYGGVSGGTRAVQMTKGVLSTLKIMPIPEAVTIPFFSRLMDGGVFKGEEGMEKAAAVMLDELARWADALAAMRA